MKQKNKPESNTPGDNKGIPICKQKIVFSSILVLLPFIVLLLIEVTLRLLQYGDPYNFFIDREINGKEYRTCNPQYGKKYFHTFNYTSPPNDAFLKEKPDSCFRLFVMGSSTVVGFPYKYNLMASRILHQRLQDSYPKKHIEVVNTAITAINSYTLQDRFDEILKEKPDAVLIYAGHNEFYGALGIGSREGLGQSRMVKRLHLHLLDLRIYQLLRNMLFKVQGLFTRPVESPENTTATLMERIVSNKEIMYQGDVYERAHEQYTANMKRILEKAGAQQVSVLFSEVISNVRDLEPFCSTQEAKLPAAENVFNDARMAEKQGQYTKAKASYYKAKDLDCIRFRAAEELNMIIRQLTHEHNAILVPMQKHFENASPNGLIGNNLLTEHVHPNIAGQFLMADGFYNTLVRHEVIGELDSLYFKPSNYYRNHWDYTELDSLHAVIGIQKLKGGWPFRPDTVENTFFETYRPRSFVDSLAYQTVRYDDKSLQAAHKSMASYHKVRSNHEKAAREYMALIRMEPYALSHYIEAGNLLIEAGKTDLALDVFLRSLSIKREAYNLSKAGELYTFRGDYTNAIPLLEEALSHNEAATKQKIARHLHEAYQQTNQPEKAQNIAPLLPSENKEEERSENVLYVPAGIKEEIQKAMRQAQQKNFDRALSILYQANETRETPLANRMIGELLLQQLDKNALPYLKKAYVAYGSQPDFLNTLCYASIYFKDLNYARKILTELKQLDPDNPQIKEYEQALSRTK